VTAAKKICSVTINEGVVTELETEIATVNSVCDKVAEDITAANADPAAIAIFNGILEALRGISKIQTKIVGNMNKSVETVVQPEIEFTVVGGARRKTTAPAENSRPEESVIQAARPTTVSSESLARAPPPAPRFFAAPVPESEDEKKLREFREAINEAEKSTLIFNLDMGRIPVMNKETMSKRATMALSAMAAKLDKNTGTTPTTESVEAIDDVLSMVENMELYGNETKTYKHPSDKMSGAFCTVPVKYEFETPAIKFKAEKVLRKVCGAQCTTPYPVGVRECIKQIVTVVKNRYPDNFVRVNVDTKNMVFKVARKPPKDAPVSKWQYREEHVPIPAMALDLTMRRPPVDFKLDIPATPPKNRKERGSVEMEVSQAQATPPSF
jgi:hypothetical protein